MSNETTYQVVTDRICSLLEKGVIPWRQPWSTSPVRFDHANVLSRKRYRGVNALMTCAQAIDRGYSSPYWLTFKQALDLGGNVRKGEKGIPIIYVNKFTKTERDGDTGEERERQIPFVKYFTVFNVQQCEKLPATLGDLAIKPAPTFAFSPIERCEQIIAGMPNRPTIQHVENAAWYRISTDVVNLPACEHFGRPSDYYATAFHELTHSTRHASRLDRREQDEAANSGRAFGCASYAREELVAEIGSAFLCAIAGIDTLQIEQSAAYVQNWLQALRNDKRMIVSAAAHAQKAAEFITNAAAAELSQDEPAEAMATFAA
jgi:antirestriction protein ArdC